MIYTFYSFKGGVGRSMALANVAELLCNRGARVLMVDFDLEAPGLERYFDHELVENRPDAVSKQRGLIDLIISYKDLRSLLQPNVVKGGIPKGEEKAVSAGAQNSINQPSVISEATQTCSASKDSKTTDGNSRKAFPFPVEPLSNFIIPIYKSNNLGGKLSLLPAGRRRKESKNSKSDSDESNGTDEPDHKEFARYSERVRSLAWDDFYLNWDGAQFFDWFRAEADCPDQFDVVLIDSRTGVTEMSGICTYHLADVVVMFAAPNYQNIDGVKKMAESLMKPQIKVRDRGKRELGLLFVPSRVDLNEKIELDRFSLGFKARLSSLNDPDLIFENDSFNDLKVPYVPYYSYREEVAARETESPAAKVLAESFERLCRILAQFDTQGGKLTDLYDPSVTAHQNLAEQQDRIARQAFSSLTNEEQDKARPILKRLVRIPEPGETTTQNSPLRVTLSEFANSQYPLIYKLSKLGLVDIAQDESVVDVVVTLAEEGFAQNWNTLKKWLEDDRTFLLWRQQLKTNVTQWHMSGQEQAALLSGKALAEARSWLKQRELDLSEMEKTYISRSFISLWRKRIIRALIISIILGITAFSIWRSVRERARLKEEELQNQELRALEAKQSGDESFSNGNFSSAVDFYSSAITTKPTYTDAYIGRANSYRALEQYDKAISDLQQLLSSNPTNPEILKTLGLTYLEKQDFVSAIDTFSKLVAIKADDPEAYYDRGVAYRRRGDSYSAKRDLDQAIKLKPDYGEALYERAFLYMGDGNDQLAAIDLNQATTVTNVPALALEAKKTLREVNFDLGNSNIAVPQGKAAQPQVFLHYNDKKDIGSLRSLATALAAYNVRGAEFRTEATVGEVRYFYEEDKTNAEAVRDLTVRSLEAMGLRQSFQLQFLGTYYHGHVPRGSIEVWVPRLNQTANINSFPEPSVDRTTATIVSIEGRAVVFRQRKGMPIVASVGMVLEAKDLIRLDSNPPTTVTLACGSDNSALRSWRASSQTTFVVVTAPWCK